MYHTRKKFRQNEEQQEEILLPMGRLVRFILGGMRFEYDEEKNRKNIQKHGISFKSAARVFF